MLTGQALGAAIEAARRLKGVSKKAMADHFGVTPPSIQDWVNRGTIDKAKLVELWRFFGDVVGPEHWGLSAEDSIGEEPFTAASAHPKPGYTRLPVLAEVAAGDGRDPESWEIVEHVDVADAWVRQTLRAHPATLRVLTARGHSMSGVIEDGDVMFVEPCDRFADDGIYVIAIDGLLRVKRLRLRVSDRQLSIESTDGSAPELVPLKSLEATMRICGRVVGAWALRRL